MGAKESKEALAEGASSGDKVDSSSSVEIAASNGSVGKKAAPDASPPSSSSSTPRRRKTSSNQEKTLSASSHHHHHHQRQSSSGGDISQQQQQSLGLPRSLSERKRSALRKSPARAEERSGTAPMTPRKRKSTRSGRSAPTTPRGSRNRSATPPMTNVSMNTSMQMSISEITPDLVHTPSTDLPLLAQQEVEDRAVAAKVAASASTTQTVDESPTPAATGTQSGATVSKARPSVLSAAGAAIAKQRKEGKRLTLTAAELASLELPAVCERCRKRPPAARVTILEQQLFMCRVCVTAAQSMESQNERLAASSPAVTADSKSKSDSSFTRSGLSKSTDSGTLRRTRNLSNALVQAAKRATGVSGGLGGIAGECCIILEPFDWALAQGSKPYQIVCPNGAGEMQDWVSALKSSIDLQSSSSSSSTTASGKASKLSKFSEAAADLEKGEGEEAADAEGHAKPSTGGEQTSLDPNSCTRGWLVKKGKRRYFVLNRPAAMLYWFSKEIALEPSALKKAKNSLSLKSYAKVIPFAAEAAQSRYVAPLPLSSDMLPNAPTEEEFASDDCPLPPHPPELPVHVYDNVNDWGVAMGGTPVPKHHGKSKAKRDKKAAAAAAQAAAVVAAELADDDDDDDGVAESATATSSSVSTSPLVVNREDSDSSFTRPSLTSTSSMSSSATSSVPSGLSTVTTPESLASVSGNSQRTQPPGKLSGTGVSGSQDVKQQESGGSLIKKKTAGEKSPRPSSPRDPGDSATRSLKMAKGAPHLNTMEASASERKFAARKEPLASDEGGGELSKDAVEEAPTPVKAFNRKNLLRTVSTNTDLNDDSANEIVDLIGDLAKEKTEK